MKSKYTNRLINYYQKTDRDILDTDIILFKKYITSYSN